jgi:hypothetical protein
MGFQKKNVSGRSEDLDFFYRRVSRELPLKQNLIKIRLKTYFFKELIALIKIVIIEGC